MNLLAYQGVLIDSFFRVPSRDFYSTPGAAPLEMAATYIKNVVGGVFSMDIVQEVIIEGHNAMPNQAEAIIAEGLAKVEAAAKSLSAVTA